MSGAVSGQKEQNDLGFLQSSSKSQGSKHPFLLARSLRKGRGRMGEARVCPGPVAQTLPPGSVLAVRWPSSRPERGDAPFGPQLPPRRYQRQRQSPESGRLRFDGREEGSGASPGQAEFSLPRRQLGCGPGPREEGPQSKQALSFSLLAP